MGVVLWVIERATFARRPTLLKQISYGAAAPELLLRKTVHGITVKTPRHVVIF